MEVSGVKTQKYWVGIDPGLTGAIGVLDSEGKLVGVFDMPTRDKQGGLVKREVSVKKLAELLKGYLGEGDILLVERVAARPEQGVSGMFSLGDSFGAVRGVCGGLGGVVVDVLPQMWRRGCGITSGSGKGGSVAKARAIFGSGVIRAGKDHGKADALLIAWYGWKKYLACGSSRVDL